METEVLKVTFASDGGCLGFFPNYLLRPKAGGAPLNAKLIGVQAEHDEVEGAD